MGIKLGKSVLVVGFAAMVAGCSPITTYHGFIPPAEEVASLQVGVSTKDEVIALLGTPLSDRALLNNTVYYAASEFRTNGPFAPREVDREVLAVEFDASSRLRNISRYGLDDGRVVVLDRRVTEDGINDVGFLEQLLGSFGRIDAGTLLGESN